MVLSPRSSLWLVPPTPEETDRLEIQGRTTLLTDAKYTSHTSSVTSHHYLFKTGAGKTHTMEGYPDPPELRGIIPKSFEVRYAFTRGQKLGA